MSNLKQQLKEYGFTITDTPNEETIWYDSENKICIQGDFDCGVRGNDHVELLHYYDLSNDLSEGLLELLDCGWSRVTPETKTIVGALEMDGYTTFEDYESQEIYFNDNSFSV